VGVDDALVVWLNRLARRSDGPRTLIAASARWLASLEIALMVALALAGRRDSAVRMLAAVGLVYLASAALGLAWPRERPFTRLAEVTPLVLHTPGRSFPSRHVASGLAMAAIGGRAHPWLGAAMSMVAWALGMSRVAAGLHYPSDVLGGVALGLAAARCFGRSA
jgi:membrane-associated phospholipid phosphatase